MEEREIDNRKNDVFADIASIRADIKGRGLVQPMPPEKEEKYLPLNLPSEGQAPEAAEKMTTPEQLRLELERQRGYYAPYMQDMAPELESLRSKIPLTGI